MRAMTQLLGISGSLRAGSYNTKLMHEAARIFAPDDLVVGNLRFPLFDEDLEEAAGIPEAVQTLADQIDAADAVVCLTSSRNRKFPSKSVANAPRPIRTSLSSSLVTKDRFRAAKAEAGEAPLLLNARRFFDASAYSAGVRFGGIKG